MPYAYDVYYITSFNFAKILFMIVLASNPKTVKFEYPDTDPDLET